MAKRLSAVPKGKSEACKNHRWAVVLAGGEGTRMQPFVQRWLGKARPKQYCNFIGSRTMLQHTVDRASALVSREHVVTIIGAGHRVHLDEAPKTWMRGHVLEQPADRGTAMGILLPVAQILARDPDATVLILPADHFVFPESGFLVAASAACQIAELHENDVVLIGAAADGPETDYGWIAPDDDHRISPSDHFRVQLFHEKPNRAEAERLFRAGALWNTMVVAARGKTLWKLGWECVPELMVALEKYRVDIERAYGWTGRRDNERRALDRAFVRAPSADFSKQILQLAPHRIRVMPLHGVQWSDWGRPERVKSTIEVLGAKPEFDLDMLDVWKQALDFAVAVGP